MATHSNVLTWRIPRTEKPGRPPCMGSHSQTRLKRLRSREGNATTSSILASEIPGSEELGGLQSNSRAFLRGGNSPRKVEALTKSPRVFYSTARTVAEDSQLPGLLILASFTRYMCGKLKSKICPGGSVVKNPPASAGDTGVIPAMGTVATREPGVPESGCRSPGRLRRDTLLEIEPPGRSRHDGVPRIGSLGSSSHDNLLRPPGTRGSPSRLTHDNLSRTRSLGRSRHDDLLGPLDWSWASPRSPV